MYKSAGDHFTLVTAVLMVTGKLYNHPKPEPSLAPDLSCGNNSRMVIYISVFTKTLYSRNSTNTESPGHPAASLSGSDHSTPIFHFLHRGVKIKNQL